jgi:hypothetical protein
MRGRHLTAKNAKVANKRLTTKCVLSLRSLAEHEKINASSTPTPMFDGILVISASVMPAWIAGIQPPRMRPDTSMSTWVPAVHAGTTSSYIDYVTHTNLMGTVIHPTKLSKEVTRLTRF